MRLQAQKIILTSSISNDVENVKGVFTADVSELSSGVYYLVLHVSGSVKIYPIVVE